MFFISLMILEELKLFVLNRLLQVWILKDLGSDTRPQKSGLRTKHIQKI